MSARMSLLIVALTCASLTLATPAEAGWDRVKAYMQASTEIVEETEERIVLRNGSGPAAVELILTMDWAPDSDVYGDMAIRRGGNPYRIWVVSERLASDESRPKSVWGRVLRAEFLRLLRPPRAQHTAR